MRVLITGSSGFIAGALISFFIEKKCRVRAVGRSVFRASNSQCEYVDYETPGIMNKIDCVIHLAAKVHDTKGSTTFERYQRVNYQLTKTLAQQAKKAGVKRFIFISTLKVNGEYNVDDRPFLSSDVPSPTGGYACSKWQGEQSVLNIFNNGLTQCLIVRLPLVYSVHAKGNLETLKHWIKRGIFLPFYGVRNKRSMVDIPTIQSFLWHCLRLEQWQATTVILVAWNISLPELIQKIAEDNRLKARLFYIPVPMLRALLSCVSMGLQRRLLENFWADSREDFRLLKWKI